jgi:hypothetical protein
MTHEPIVNVTPRHRKFVKGLIAGKSPSAAAISAGYTEGGYGSHLMKQPAVQSILVAEMEKQGLTDSILVRKLRDGLNAQTVPRREGGQRYDDQFVRKQFLDIIFKVRGDYAPERTESTEKKIVLIMDGRMQKALKDTGKLTLTEAEVLEAEVVDELEADSSGEISESAVVDRSVLERPLLSLPNGSGDT